MHELQCPAVWAVCADGVKVLVFYPQAFFDCWSEQIAKIFLQALHWDVAFWEKNPRFPPQIMYFSHCVCVHVHVCVRGVFHVVVADKQHKYLLNLITTELQTPVNWSISCCAPIQLTHTRSHKMPSRQSWNWCTGKLVFIAYMYSLLV